MPGRVVDPVYVPATITVPKGTTAAAPQETVQLLPVGILESVTVQIPPGHVGATGIRFTLAGQQILPWSNTVAWIIGDNLIAPFDVDLEIDRGFKVVTFNVGNYDHNFFLRFKVRQLPAAVSAFPTLRVLPPDQLTGTG